MNEFESERRRENNLRVSGPWREIGGVQYCTADKLISRAPKALCTGDQSPFANAIRQAFPNSSPFYWNMIARRYRETFKDLPEDEATLAVSQGYSSPLAAMRARVIPKRKYIGYGEQR
jgi:hypothetical protein